jgi:uncharacterized protein with NRDE domain
MCTLFITRGRSRWPFILAANRDEMLARPWSPPRRMGEALYPIDDQAGGTWIGVNRAGLVAGITNRLPIPIEAGRHSRGELCVAALGEESLDAAVAGVRAAVARTAYNGFNLVLGARDAAVLLTYGEGRLVEAALPEGVSVVTSRHDLDPAGLDATRARIAATSDEALHAELAHTLADHGSHGDDEYVICKHGELYGTRSASIITVPESGAARFQLASGRPCENDFMDVP